jgi:hypothetical protein
VLFYEIAIGIISSKRHVRFASKGSFRKHVSNDMQSRGETVPPVIENKTPDRDPEAVESMDVGCPEQGKCEVVKSAYFYTLLRMPCHFINLTTLPGIFAALG